VNGSGNEGAPNLSHDGHLLFFQSDRPGGPGGGDIYVSQRADPNDDFGWGPPVILGPDVNTAAFDGGATYLQSAEHGAATLYFGRGPSAVDQNIYSVPVTRDGVTLGPAVLVLDLSDLTVGVTDAHASVRTDGREVFFYSNRPGGFGLSDLWMSTRRSVHDTWSTPENLGAPMNTTFIDTQPTLSHDARTLVFSSNRPGGVGLNDIWMSTRTRIGR
jgi:WD40 repeat protein